VRSDVSYQFHSGHRLESGVYLRRLHLDSFNQNFQSRTVTPRVNQTGSEQAYYVQDTWSDEKLGLSLTGGARIEHSGLTQQTLFSPRASVGWSIAKDWNIRGGVGRYHQFPNLDQLFARSGNPLLKAESATHYNLSVERLFGDRMRVLVEGYDREDRDLFFSAAELRSVNGGLSFLFFPFLNSLNGHARGVELTVQRRSANKLAGWVSYAYSRTQLTDSQTGLSFVSDADQRHTVNVYGSYRFTDTWDMAGEWRYGSGQPIPGFYRQVGSDYFLTDQRNLARLPDYSRVDVRVSKAFLLKRWKLTVTGEVINLLNRDNVRFTGFDGVGPNGRVFGGFERLLPILPSAGVVVEF